MSDYKILYREWFPFNVLNDNTGLAPAEANIQGGGANQGYFPFAVPLTELAYWYWNIQQLSVVMAFSYKRDRTEGSATDSDHTIVTASSNQTQVFDAVDPRPQSFQKRMKVQTIEMLLPDVGQPALPTMDITTTDVITQSGKTINFPPSVRSGNNAFLIIGLFYNLFLGPAASRTLGVVKGSDGLFYPRFAILDWPGPALIESQVFLSKTGAPTTSASTDGSAGGVPLDTIGTFTFGTYTCPIYGYTGDFRPGTEDADVSGANTLTMDVTITPIFTV